MHLEDEGFSPTPLRPVGKRRGPNPLKTWLKADWGYRIKDFVTNQWHLSKWLEARPRNPKSLQSIKPSANTTMSLILSAALYLSHEPLYYVISVAFCSLVRHFSFIPSSLIIFVATQVVVQLFMSHFKWSLVIFILAAFPWISVTYCVLCSLLFPFICDLIDYGIWKYE